MTQETFNALATALENANFWQLFSDVTGGISAEDYEKDTKFGLSFNVETNELQFINYISNEDTSWKNAYEQQNPCIIVGYVGAEEIIAGNPADRITEYYLYQNPELERVNS
jgi:hypothetical protein